MGHEQRGLVADRNRNDPKENRGGNVDEREGPRVFATEEPRFKCECRKRGESAEHTGKQQQSRVGGKGSRLLGDSGQHPDDKTTHGVDRQSPERKAGCRSCLRNEAAQEVSGHRADEATGAYEQEFAHV